MLNKDQQNILPAHFFNGASGMSGFGDNNSESLYKQNEAVNKTLETASKISMIFSLLSIASAAACTYHGYKRNESVGWAIGWGLLGGCFPVITPAIAVAQGFGKKKV